MKRRIRQNSKVYEIYRQIGVYTYCDYIRHVHICKLFLQFRTRLWHNKTYTSTMLVRSGTSTHVCKIVLTIRTYF